MKKVSAVRRLSMTGLVLLFLVSSCGQTAETNSPGEDFLTAFFTSNQDMRWDTLQSADLSSQESANAATADYFSGLSSLCTEDCLDSVSQNRQLSQLDSLAEQYDCALVPKTVTVSTPNESNAASFEVELTVQRDGSDIGTVSQKGELTFADDSDAPLVDHIWFANLDNIASFLQEAQ